MSTEHVYTERQRFTQWWVWFILGGLVVLTVYALIQQIILGEPFGEHPMPDLALIGFGLLVIGLAILIWIARLDTRIDRDQIELNFFPFVKRQIQWSEVDHVKMIRYGFVGYGIRVGTRHGTVYNTGGRDGLMIQLKSGKKLVIGTLQPQLIEAFIGQLNG